MSVKQPDVGHRPKLKNRIGKALFSATAATCFAAALWLASSPVTIAGGETRTISLYQINTKENLSVTYMKDGRYVPSALKKINYLLRDWRRDAVVNIDPKTLDLVWELHEDLGSQRPIHIVSGYRSPRTNAFLKRIGRNVARHSQHMNGKAIDFYFPDVTTLKIRNSALVRKVGGVGYYRTSGGPTGFLHVDSGKVRHWGPRISNSQWASINREASKFVGRRLQQSGSFANATETKPKSGGLLAWFTGGKKPPVVVQVEPTTPVETNPVYAGGEDDLADLAADVSAIPLKSKLKNQPQDAVSDTSFGDEQIAQLTAKIVGEQPAVKPDGVNVGYPVPLPRLKPIEIMMMAAANMKIEPASAQPDDTIVGHNAVDSDVAVATADNIEPQIEIGPMVQTTNVDGKSDFAAGLPEGMAMDVPTIRPVLAASMTDELNWWPQLISNSEALMRRNGTPPLLDSETETPLPVAAILSGDDSESTKEDRQVVMREGKGNLDPAFFALSANQ